MAMERFAIFTVLAAALISAAYAIPGTATYYTTYVPSACYGYGNPATTLIAAANPSLYNNGAACGSTYTITCTGGIPPCTGSSVTVTVVDLCPGCGDNQFDLSQEAFSQIADLNAGRISIDYYQV